jgi:cell division protein FtsQ
MRALKNIALWSFIVLYLAIISGTITDKRHELLCNSLDINIIDSASSAFLYKDDIKNLVLDNMEVLGKPLEAINLKILEERLMQNRIIKSAEAYSTEDGIIHIQVSQREPVIRFITGKNKSFYVDREGNMFPLSKRFRPHILVANGHIHEPFNLDKTKNIFVKNYNDLPRSKKAVYDIFILANYINQKEFWRAQIEQIYVNEKYEYELIPRVGSHVILFGSIDDYEEKFENLKTLYMEGFNKIGWNDYEQINLEYKDQIICTKR